MSSLSRNAAVAAFSSTALISLAPNVILVLFPHYGSGDGAHSPILSLGQALAAGGLLGDVFLHVIPHSLERSPHNNDHDDEKHQGGPEHEVGLWILFGFTIFLMTDMLIRVLSSKGHSHGKKKEENGKNTTEANVTSTILLNLAADALHNFTDGLAIGATYANHVTATTASLDELSVWALLFQSRGGLATLSILCHEVPHELGDFAVLVKHGFSKKDAILAQFGTAVAAMIGTAVGLVLQDYTGGDRLVLLTAGGFLYLAAVTILPDLLEEDGHTNSAHHHNDNDGTHNRRSTVPFRFGQLLCFIIGIGSMYAVGMLEGMDSHHGHSHSHSHHGHSDSLHHHGHHHEHRTVMEQQSDDVGHHGHYGDDNTMDHQDGDHHGLEPSYHHDDHHDHDPNDAVHIHDPPHDDGHDHDSQDGHDHDSQDGHDHGHYDHGHHDHGEL